ncbi:helix-turn-helix transcriptional regulator [Streptomyces griseus]|uniref:helix-turn-helix transcriptional regulator n=1 Tax=Streptomyces griseus TaxID=1911 RepID=UPI0007C430BA|nr:helix-turn-helix transcriptional regulator [Streptomyces griseus]
MSGPTVPEDGTSGTPPTGHGPEDGTSGTPHPHHGPEELCAPARLLYTDALQRGGVTSAEADRVPCLARLGLLRPDPHDPGRRLPVPAAAALTELLAPLTRDIHARVAASAALVEALAPLAPLTGSPDDPAMTVIQGKPAIQAAVAEAGKAARKRILTLHPGSKRPDVMLEQARQSAIEPLRRGVSMRHLYQHSARYNMNLKQYVDRLPQGDLQIRTMEQTAERMFVFDRSAYISISPVTAVQHSIARLLAAGHVDDDIARRMGISVRTCRSHIARLMQTLGANSRTHLGALLIGSGIVEAHRRD